MTEHIPTPPDPLYHAIEVPCLSDVVYDELDFCTYPARRGWDLNLLKSGDFDQHPRDTTAAFVQDWLYFGVLYEVLGVRREQYTVSTPRQGRPVVSTKNLRQDLLFKLSAVNDALIDRSDPAPESVLVWLSRSEICLELMGYFCNITNMTLNGEDVTWPVPFEVDLAIRALGRALTSLCLSVIGNTHDTILSQTYFQGSPLCVARMVEQNWCPSEISRALSQFSSSTLLYASQLKRPTADRDHRHCTNTKCHAFFTNHMTYKTQHAEPHCNCTHILPDLDETVRIALSGRIPLLSVRRGASGSMEIDVKAFNRGDSYIAVSHVWADGLGNAESNSLPECQILNLTAILMELDARTRHSPPQKAVVVHFWIDTICVPLAKVSPAGRERAIEMMKDIYANASQVIVLDAELMATEHRDMTDSFMRVSLSGWLRRLWTLHEGVLAEHVLVKFKNIIIDIQEGYNELDPKDESWRSSLERRIDTGLGTLTTDVKQFYWRMRGLRMDLFSTTESSPRWKPYADAMRRCQNVLQAFEASRFRTTSRKEDVYICMANLLGSRVDLWSVPVEQRLRLILEPRAYLPQGIIFIPGPRMKEPGWQWAVSEFDYDGQSMMKAWTQDFNPAVRDEQGLVVEYPGLILKSLQISSMTTDFVIGVYSEASRDKRIWWRVEVLPMDTVTAGTIDDPKDPTKVKGSEERQCLIYYPKAPENIFKNIPMAAVLVSVGSATSAEILDTEKPLACSFVRLAMVHMVGDDSDLLNLLRRPDLNVRLWTEYTAGRVKRKWTIG